MVGVLQANLPIVIVLFLKAKLTGCTPCLDWHLQYSLAPEPDIRPSAWVCSIQLGIHRDLSQLEPVGNKGFCDFATSHPN